MIVGLRTIARVCEINHESAKVGSETLKENTKPYQQSEATVQLDRRVYPCEQKISICQEFICS